SRPWTDFVEEDGRAQSDSNLARRRAGVRESYELRMIRKDGSPVWVSVSSAPIFDADGRFAGSISGLTDISARKRTEWEREAMAEFLRMVNRSAGTDDLVRQATVFFQERAGCSAVGIRLKEGDDYPYREARGFPPEFVAMENRLCARDDRGEILRGPTGDPVLECMCGNVILGRFDPSRPFFTAHGSFFANSATGLFSTTTETDRLARTRDRCDGEGYESVALIPLRVGEERLGLLQLNDRRPGMFSPETVGQWEHLADHLAVALAKSRADEALRKANEELEARVRARTAELSETVDTLRREVSLRQEAEAALAERSRILEAYFRHSATPLVLLDRRFDFVRVNDAYAKAGGRDAASFPGLNHFDLYPNAENQAIFSDVVRTRVAYRAVAKPFVYPDHPEWGVTYWDWTLTPLLDQTGEVEFLVFALEDVTQRTLADQRVRAASRYTRHLLEVSLDPLVTISPDGKITDVNEATEQATGVGRDRLVGSDFSDHFTEPGRAREGYREVLARGLVREYPLTIRHTSGRTMDVLFNASVYRDEAGGVQGVFAAARDVTRRNAAERLQAMTGSLLALFAEKSSRKEYLDSVVEVVRSWTGCRCVGIRVVDQERNIPYESFVGFAREFWELENWLSLKTDACACIRVVLGTPEPQDLPAMTPGGSFHLSDSSTFLTCLGAEERSRFRGNCIRAGFTTIAVLSIRYRDQTLGALHLADERGGILTAGSVEVLESMCPLIAEAIHRFNVEERLRVNYRALQKSEARLRELNDALALRTDQLRALAGELTLAEQRERRRMARVLHDELQQLLVGAKFRTATLSRGVSPSIQRAIQEIEGLLDEAIATSRSLTAELSPPILHEGSLVGGLEWLQRWMAQKHGLAVDLTVAKEIPAVPEDVKVLLFESVRELLFNAVKHARARSVAVDVRGTQGGELWIAVSDSGPGFDPLKLSTAGGLGGGFGLFSIRERLGLIGGGLKIESTPGKGSRFVLNAPMVREPGEPVTPAPGSAEYRAGGPAHASVPAAHARIRVLVADDHQVMREGLARLLGQEPDIEVVGEACDGETAVELARQLGPHVVLMDLSMPRLGGIEATRLIRQKLPEIQVIGLSMFDEDELAQAMREAGAYAYLAKSGPTEAVIEAIRLCASRREATPSDSAAEAGAARADRPTGERAC
ncbi:MAG: PAS domain S-box protein, partial [Candidatus Riflebacteria bacterium]|nr:PAS domain S-box protein [Candidatus Riflebacteria bacterium]